MTPQCLGEISLEKMLSPIDYSVDIGDGYTCFIVKDEQDQKDLLDYMYKFYMQGLGKRIMKI